jgi:hypothetical protein
MSGGENSALVGEPSQGRVEVEDEIDRKAILLLGNWAKPASQGLITFGHHHSCTPGL